MENESQNEKEREAILEYVRGLLSQVYRDRQRLSAAHESILAQAQFLRQKYPDYEAYRMYHLLIQSSPHEERLKFLDFPGEDSVVKYLESLAKEYE